MRRISSYKHVVWDWNGTLLDDQWLCVEALNELLTMEGRPPIAFDHYRSIFEFPVIRVYEALGLPTDEWSFKAGSIAFMAAYEARRLECELHPETRDTLAAITRAGVDQSLFSAYRHDLLEGIVGAMNLGGHFRSLSGNRDIYAAGKADRALAHREAYGLAPGEMLYIGDTTHDAETAAAMGADCILVAHGHQPRHKLEATGHPVVENFAELIARL